MSETRFERRWQTGLSIAAAIVAAVAALLLAIIGTARSILGNATRALEVANEIVANTHAIWELETTHEVAAELVREAKAIEEHATEVAEALEKPQPAS